MERNCVTVAYVLFRSGDVGDRGKPCRVADSTASSPRVSGRSNSSPGQVGQGHPDSALLGNYLFIYLFFYFFII